MFFVDYSCLASSSASLRSSGNGKNVHHISARSRAVWVAFGKETVTLRPDMHNRVLELNASDERGIDVGGTIPV